MHVSFIQRSSLSIQSHHMPLLGQRSLSTAQTCFWFGLVSFGMGCFGLIWFAWFWFCSVWFGMTKLNSEPPHAIASTEIGINIANSANMVWLAFGLVCFGMRFFGLILCLINISDNMWGTRQIHSLCMLLKISLLQTGLQVDFGMCLQDIKGLDSGSTYLDIHHNSEFHHPHNCQFGIRFGMFSPLWDTFAKKRSRLAKSFRLAIILYSSLCRCKLWH